MELLERIFCDGGTRLLLARASNPIFKGAELYGAFYSTGDEAG